MSYASLALALVKLANLLAQRAHDRGVFDAGRTAELLRAHEAGAGMARRARIVAGRAGDPGVRAELRDVTTRGQ